MKASSTLPDQGSRAPPSGAAGWTYDAFLKSAEACARPLIWARADWRLDQQTSILYFAFGAELVNANGEITVDTDALNEVLDYGRKLVKFLPDDVVSCDDASNNRWLISGKAR